MTYIAQILFILCFAGAAYVISRRFSRIGKNIGLGRPENRRDRPAERWKTMLLIAFGQKKMFDKPLVGFMHFVIYAGFLLINIEVLEILFDGVFGTHRILAPFLGSAYPALINGFEFLAFGVLVVCVVFLCRRNLIKVRRFQPGAHREMTRWPRLDANLILVTEILLMWAFLSMNATDVLLQERGVGHYADVRTGAFAFSQFLTPLFEGWSTPVLVFYERFAWWFHILGILAFGIYVTYSKHLHIFLAFPNAYFSRLEPKGEMQNMPEVTKEVRLMLGLDAAASVPAGTDAAGTESAPGRFGAKDVGDLTWKNLMDAYSCTECGRCTAACPANITGKKLSPRKIMMDTRDRLQEVGEGIEKHGTGHDDGKSLFGNYITSEEIMACTTCNACVQECPVNIDPL
ncbi:MAG: (Fe-S)-binding protein, partial [Ferruginibacter sp.]|nr:(Fe-S)-binding protein [Cytophagales bacterium]